MNAMISLKYYLFLIKGVSYIINLLRIQMILGEYSAGLYFQISSITAGVCILVMYSISQS